MSKEDIKQKSFNNLIKACNEMNYELITTFEDFKNNNSIVKYICPIHGIQEKKAGLLKCYKHCSLCANTTRSTNMNKTKDKIYNKEEMFYQKALNICDNLNYKLITKQGEIKRNKDYLIYECDKHGIKKIRYDNLCSGKKCPDCNKDNARERYMMDINEVESRIEKCGGKLLNKKEYINIGTKNLEIICPRCHTNIITTSLKLFTQHGGMFCSECYKKESVGEKNIREWLEKNNIDYIQQKWFSDCRDTNPLPFDFYLPNNNKIIEFDGKQHDEKNHFFSRKDDRFDDDSMFDYIKYHDKIKTEYCLNNNIDLLRIKYTEINNIENILTDYLIA